VSDLSPLARVAVPSHAVTSTNRSVLYLLLILQVTQKYSGLKSCKVIFETSVFQEP